MLREIKQELERGKTLTQFGFLKATGQALGMIAPLVIAKFFSPELFGSYCLAKMVVFFFSMLLISSSQVPFIVFANQEKTRTGKINEAFSVQAMFLILSFCIFAAIALPLNKYIAAFAKISRADLFFVLLAFAGLALKTFLCGLFMALGQRIKNSVVELVFGSLTLSLVFALYLTDAINLRRVFLVYLISGLLVVFIFIKTIEFDQLRPFSLGKQHFKDMFNFTKWVMAGSTAVYLISWGDNLVLRLFTAMEDIGTYNLGYQVFKGVAALTSVLGGYFLPFVSQHITDTAKMRNYLSNKRPKIFLLGLVLIGLLFLIAPYLFKLVYGEVYHDSITVLRILLIGSVPILYVVFYTPILNALKKYKFTQTVNLLQVLLNLLLDLLLVPLMGMLGAAVATVIGYFCKIVVYELYFRTRLNRLLGL